jgi:hypothetical protein
LVHGYADSGSFVGLWYHRIVEFWINEFILKESLKAMKARNNPFTMFLAYFYLTYFLGLFTGGRPNDTPYWFVFAVMIRFMGVTYLDLLPKGTTSSVENSNPTSPATQV